MLYDLGFLLAGEQFPTLEHSEEGELNFDSTPPTPQYLTYREISLKLLLVRVKR